MKPNLTQRFAVLPAVFVCAFALNACTLRLAAPEKPITINLNVKIEHEVRVKVEKDLDNLFKKEDGIF